MTAMLDRNDVAALYALEVERQPSSGPAAPTIVHLVEAWQALERLEVSLSNGTDRWQADSIRVAKEGIRRAWLAVSNLDRGFRRQA